MTMSTKRSKVVANKRKPGETHPFLFAIWASMIRYDTLQRGLRQAWRSNAWHCFSIRQPIMVGCLLALTTSMGCLPSVVSAQSSPPFRIGFSTTTLDEVNENDAIAALRIWTQSIVQERGIPADPQPKIMRSISQITEVLTQKAVDCINLSTPEYAMLGDLVARDTIVAAVLSDTITEEYLLIVNRQSGIESIDALRGLTLVLLKTARTALSRIWLDTILARHGLGSADVFFGPISKPTKIGQAVLPVFFHRMDACVITRKGYQTMVELNPQIGKQLVVLATSPPVVPVLFCFRSDYQSPFRPQILEAIADWHYSSAGRQILTLFQTDNLAQRPASCLDSALELIADHQRYYNPLDAQPIGVKMDVKRQMLEEQQHP